MKSEGGHNFGDRFEDREVGNQSLTPGSRDWFLQQDSVWDSAPARPIDRVGSMKAWLQPFVEVVQMKFRSLSLLMTAIVLVVALSSCGTSFRSDWNAARAKDYRAGGIEGAWEGFWLSAVNGHAGKLWCVIKEGSSNERTFDYRATWKRILSAGFSAKHQLVRKGSATSFTVDHPIGSLGTFHAEGTITADKFSACYEAAGDRGTFELRRPQRLPQP